MSLLELFWAIEEHICILLLRQLIDFSVSVPGREMLYLGRCLIVHFVMSFVFGIEGCFFFGLFLWEEKRQVGGGGKDDIEKIFPEDAVHIC